jgi:ADP-heptose:LPS heptosyltransferase
MTVGLVWAGRSTNKKDALRSIAFSQLAPLRNIANVTFFSLQKGKAAGQCANVRPGMELIDLTGGLNDFADTAAMVSHLDLVIAVDTAVAHLAGALGKQVWTLIPSGPDWRWMLDREDSPWYPTMRLFRQSKAGDWDHVIERVGIALKICATQRNES